MLSLVLSTSLAALASAPSTRAPSQRTRVGIAPLSSTADGVDRIERSLLEAMVDHDTDAVSVEGRCDDRTCRALQAQAGALDYLVQPEVHGALNDYRMQLALFDASGRRLQTVDFTCEICTPEDAAGRMREHAARLRETMGERAPEATGPGERPALPHPVSPARGPARDDAPVARRQRALRIAGWTTLSAGVTALALGSALLGLDERPYRTRCTGSARDVNGECEFLYDTLAGGAASVAIGGAALATGVILAVLGRRRPAAGRTHMSIGPRAATMEVRF